MILQGNIIAIVILVLSIIVLGPYGIVILIIILFGMVFSTYQKNKQISVDLQMIREKLGLLREEEKVEIELKRSEEEYKNAIRDPEFMTEIDKQIEEELEKHVSENDRLKDNKD
ncbi:hypothetical protein ACX1C1_19770 [Paenibacillus sp. strain BS8-2]